MRTAILIIAAAMAASSLAAQSATEVGKLSLDDLMNVEVTSVARRGQSLSDTPAAVFVITQEDIQRSGATSIAELLRMVPGLDVASVDGSLWAIRARGFNGRWANKLLVMIDGRTVFSPLFSGVDWDAQDTMLEDIERIEVIRGPGGTLWGANAVNGVINIITKSAIATHGGIVSAGAGSAERAFGAARFGGALGDNLHYRVFAKAFDRAWSDNHGGHPSDHWRDARMGFRLDWLATPHDNVTLQGDIYDGRSQETQDLISPADPFHGERESLTTLRGENVLLRWTQTQSARSETALQVYYDHGDRGPLPMSEENETIDVDFQHQLTTNQNNELVWGAGYRRYSVKTKSPLQMLTFDDPSPKLDFFSGFLQDEVKLPHNIHLTFGTKIGHDSSSKFQLQPTLRVLWKPTEQSALWSAVTSAVRTISQIELDGHLTVAAGLQPNGTTVLTTVNGNPNLKPERVLTYEGGYRWQSATGTSIDATAYYARLKNIVNPDPVTPYTDSYGRLIVPLVYTNDLRGVGKGLEVFATRRVTRRWELSAGYTLQSNVRSDAEPGVDASANIEDVPARQIQLKSFFEITPSLEFNTSVYRIGALTVQGVPGYTRVDARLAWHPVPALELSIAGQNLMNGKHREFSGLTAAGLSTLIERSVYGKVTWRF